MNVELQTMDLGTMFRRRASKEPRDKGGWNVYFTVMDGMFSASPATHYCTPWQWQICHGRLAR